MYYDLFNKYRSDYQVDQILAGNVTDEIKERALNAGFDERLSLIGLLLYAVTSDVKEVIDGKKVLEQLMNVLKQFRVEIAKGKALPVEILETLKANEVQKLDKGRKAGSLSADGQARAEWLLAMLDENIDRIAAETDGMQAFGLLKMDFDARVKAMKQNGIEKGALLENLFLFSEEVFTNGHELLIIVTELTTNYYTARYISEYGCEKYIEHNKELLFYERQKKLMQELDGLNLDEAMEA